MERMWEDLDWVSASCLLWVKAVNLVWLWIGVPLLLYRQNWALKSKDIGTKAGSRACAGYNSIQKRCGWTALFLSVSADSSSNPMSSFALLCSGITLCPLATEMDWGHKIVNLASYFTWRLSIVYTWDQSTGEIIIYRNDHSTEALLSSPAVELFGLSLSCFYLSFYPSALANWSWTQMTVN